MRLAKAVKAYLDKRVDIDALVLKYGVENAVEIVGTIFDRLHSLRVEYSREWSRLVSLAMRQKIKAVKAIRFVLKNVRRVINSFRTPRVHRNRRMRVAFSSADSGGDAGPDDARPDVAPECSFLASLPEVVR